MNKITILKLVGLGLSTVASAITAFASSKEMTKAVAKEVAKQMVKQ